MLAANANANECAMLESLVHGEESLWGSNLLLSNFSPFKYLKWDRELVALHSTPYTVRRSESTQATSLDFF